MTLILDLTVNALQQHPLTSVTFTRGSNSAVVRVTADWTIGDLRAECENVTGLQLAGKLLVLEDGTVLPSKPDTPLRNLTFNSATPKIDS